MATWTEFEADAPELAGAGRRLIYARGHPEALLATVRDDAPPRIHPISVAIVEGRLLAFILPSPKRLDLERDGRYALHAHQDPVEPSEFSARGRAAIVKDGQTRAAAAAVWPFTVDDSYELFDFSIEKAVLGVRSADEWPPRYSSWQSG